MSGTGCQVPGAWCEVPFSRVQVSRFQVTFFCIRQNKMRVDFIHKFYFAMIVWLWQISISSVNATVITFEQPKTALPEALARKCSVKRCSWKFIKKETLAQVFSCEFCEISKIPPVAASALLRRSYQKVSWKYVANLFNPSRSAISATILKSHFGEKNSGRGRGGQEFAKRFRPPSRKIFQLTSSKTTKNTYLRGWLT